MSEFIFMHYVIFVVCCALFPGAYNFALIEDITFFCNYENYCSALYCKYVRIVNVPRVSRHDVCLIE